ncbi:MAG TPA: hypothetical protein VGE08_05630 [Steroidobacter sp.]|uniref:hypothetical protein n=1 Tax=Steroidobacter sp. TaxID=1978227 RepID=UPI002EDB865D
MSRPIHILLQTTIEYTANDWHIGRFSMLREYLMSLQGEDGQSLFNVTARDRDPIGTADSVLSALDRSSFDQLWLFAVDTGDGLHVDDLMGIQRFWQRGGGLMIARDHMDLGCSICELGLIGAANIFHSHNAISPVPPPDDRGTGHILWPNFHSGANGDFQRIRAELPVHPIMLDPNAESGTVMYLPAHPHEGAVMPPPLEAGARVIATGRSRMSGLRFNIAVAFEGSQDHGPALTQSTFHHFADYNWDPNRGSPDFVTETPGGNLPATPEAVASVHCYVRNLASWLAGRL